MLGASSVLGFRFKRTSWLGFALCPLERMLSAGSQKTKIAEIPFFCQGMASLGPRTENKRGPWLALMGFSGLILGSQKDTRATQKMTRHFLGNQWTKA